MTIVEQIRAEIERLEKEYYPGRDMTETIVQGAFTRLLSSLATLQEQPVCEGLDEEISNYIEKHFGESWDGCVPVGCFELDKMARHFAQWGAEHLKK